MDQMHHKNHPYGLVPNLTPDRDRGGDRVPQWTQAETKEFLAIRSHLDRSFSEAKRNKALWETVSSRLHLKGFTRTPDQCKSKWKNLVTRFKGSEALEGGDRFPFQEEMREIFSGRMERLLRFDRGNAGQEDEIKNKKRRKKAVASGGEVEKALREFGERQVEMHMRLIEAAEAREADRRSMEEEWRRQMAALAEERVAAERRWREREEERRAREEVRDERRHAVILAIVTRINANLGSSSCTV